MGDQRSTEAQFSEAIAAAGLEPPHEIVADGTFHRFASNGERGDDAGWYVLHLDENPAGCFGCWRTGVERTWRATPERPLTATEASEHRIRMAAARKAGEDDKDRRHAEAAVKAKRIWDAAKPATDEHPYLVRKGIQGCGVRQYDGKLIVPVHIGSSLRSLQFIDQNGDKRFLKFGQIQGGYFGIGTTLGAKVLCVAEGFATAATIHEATDFPVAVAFNAGNLQSVVKTMHARYPELRLIICGDNDVEVAGNPGRTKATEAAQSVHARVIFPERLSGVTDFNDMAKCRGLEAVRAAVDAAEIAPAVPVEVVDYDWPELVSIDTPDLPRLKTQLLPEWAGDYAAALAISTETPPELAIALVLATCSAAAARCLRVQIREGYCEPCNLWLVVALPPGNRKSAVQSSATAPLVTWETETAAKAEPEILRVNSERETLVARVKELRKEAAKNKDRQLAEEWAKEASDIEAALPEIPHPPQLWTSDSTPERMGTLLADNDERMAWLSSEGGVFDMLQGRYSNKILNLDLILKTWSGDPERIDRKTGPTVYLKNPLLTIGLTPQPEVLRGLAACPGFRGRGLIARFLYLLPPSPLGYRTLEVTPISDGVCAAYSSGVRAMLGWEPVNDVGGELARQLRLSSAAYSDWLDFAKYIESGMRPGGDFEHINDWAGKAPGVGVRIAGVLHAIKHAHGVPWEAEISAETMEDALEIMAVTTRHSQSAMNWMGADETVAAASRVWQWIAQGRREHFSVREAYQSLKGTFQRVKPLRDALDTLEERGYIRIVSEPRSKPGRPSPAVEVRPDIVEGWR